MFLSIAGCVEIPEHMFVICYGDKTKGVLIVYKSVYLLFIGDKTKLTILIALATLCYPPNCADCGCGDTRTYVCIMLLGDNGMVFLLLL